MSRTSNTHRTWHMLTTTDDPGEIQACYEFGCNCYITKPVEFTAFGESLRRVGLFLKVVRVPKLNPRANI